MHTTRQLIEALRVKLSEGQRRTVSDAAISRILGLSNGAMPAYNNKGVTLSDSVAIKVAEHLEMDPGYVLACMHAERAKLEADRAAWRKVAERLGGVAACLVLALVVFPGIDLPSPGAMSEAAAPLCVLCQIEAMPIGAAILALVALLSPLSMRLLARFRFPPPRVN